MRQDTGSIDSLPYKGIVWELIDQIPRQLLGQEECNTAFADNLRELTRISKGIGLGGERKDLLMTYQPKHRTAFAKLLLEKALAIQKLTHKAFATGDVAVHFHPRSTNWNKLTFLSIGLHFGEQRGVLRSHPFELLSLRCCKLVLGILLHQRDLSCPAECQSHVERFTTYLRAHFLRVSL